MIQHDFHIHSAFSIDSQAEPKEMVAAAIRNGLKSICFTEHMDYDNEDEDFAFHDSIDNYFQVIMELKREYGHTLKIFCGTELGLQEHLNERYSDLLSDYPFDFVIGSSHMVHKEDPYNASYFESRGEWHGYKDYFESILSNVNSFFNYDVYGHLDYVVRYGPAKNQNYRWDDYIEIWDAILETLIKQGKGIEINTAGFKYGLGQPHPHPGIIKRYRELGGEMITIGSDAHGPEHVGHEFKKAQDILLDCGFRYYTAFSKRKPVMYPLT